MKPCAPRITQVSRASALRRRQQDVRPGEARSTGLRCEIERGQPTAQGVQIRMPEHEQRLGADARAVPGEGMAAEIGAKRGPVALARLGVDVQPLPERGDRIDVRDRPAHRVEPPEQRLAGGGGRGERSRLEHAHRHARGIRERQLVERLRPQAHVLDRDAALFEQGNEAGDVGPHQHDERRGDRRRVQAEVQVRRRQHAIGPRPHVAGQRVAEPEPRPVLERAADVARGERYLKRAARHVASARARARPRAARWRSAPVRSPGVHRPRRRTGQRSRPRPPRASRGSRSRIRGTPP